MKGNLLNSWPVISTKWAAKFLNISYAAFIKEIDIVSNKGTIRWQACITDQDNSRPILGFEQPYLVDVLKVLGKERQKGKAIFTADIKAKIERINKRWSERRE